MDEIQVLDVTALERIDQRDVFAVLCFYDLHCPIHQPVGDLLSCIKNAVQSGEKHRDLIGCYSSI